MIAPNLFLDALGEANITFVTGVPDSLLKDICACITDNFAQDQHVIATNEGSAIGLAIGHYLATQKPALVYMQNSGLGNTVNPLTSLADPQVFGVPMVLMVGWRGEIKEDGQQIQDEPQHVKQGQMTASQLEILGIPYEIIDAHTDNIAVLMKQLSALAISRSGPVALLVRKKTFEPYQYLPKQQSHTLHTREAVIKTIINVLPDTCPVIATTGMASRELFEHRQSTGNDHSHDFLTVGGMGLASQIATGVAMHQSNEKVLCIDGDGALLMHMGSLTLSAKQSNLIHIVINNGAHDSVGGQPTVAGGLSLSAIALACGYGFVTQVSTKADIDASVKQALLRNTSVFIEVKCKSGSRKNLGRPTRTPEQNKQAFMQFLSVDETTEMTGELIA